MVASMHELPASTGLRRLYRVHRYAPVVPIACRWLERCIGVQVLVGWAQLPSRVSAVGRQRIPASICTCKPIITSRRFLSFFLFLGARGKFTTRAAAALSLSLSLLSWGHEGPKTPARFARPSCLERLKHVGGVLPFLPPIPSYPPRPWAAAVMLQKLRPSRVA